MVVHSQGESQPPIATIVSYGLSSFEALLSALDGTLPERSAAVSHLARFRLWAGSLGAHRPSGSRSLAYRLRDASTIKNHIISLLQDLCESVDEGVRTAKETSREVLVLAARENVGAEVGDSTDVALEDYFRDDADGHSEISRILDYVGHTVDCLLRMSITIRNPAPHDHFKSRVGTDLVGRYEEWDIKHIREKFPNALPGLAERLGKATARRRQYFKYREEHVGKLAEGLDVGEVVEGDGGDKATTNASSIPNYLKESHATDNFAESDGESNISRTSYAPSTASETQLRVPPLPKEYSEGPFQCPYCRMIVSINTRHDWKKHVFRDLRPYVCLSSSCTTPEQQHLRRSDWIEHMKRHHWRTWRCPYGSLCDDFRSARDFEEHVERKHSNHGSLPFLDALQNLSSHTDLGRAKGNCPLCSNFQIMSDKQYISHVAAHLEQLALFGLPSTDSEGEESDDIGSKSNGQGGDWKGYDAESLSSMDGNYIARRERRHPGNIDTEETAEDEAEYTAGDFGTINDLDTSLWSPFAQPDLASSPPQLPSGDWSVSEIEAFPGLLHTFGTDWAKIADCMPTKTATMVENFYVVNTRNGDNLDWELFAIDADEGKRQEKQQPKHAPPPGGPLEQINKISARFETEMRHLCEDFIANPPGTASEIREMHRTLSESVMQYVLLPLDNVDLAGEQGARRARREAVRKVHEVLRRLDAVLGS